MALAMTAVAMVITTSTPAVLGNAMAAATATDTTQRDCDEHLEQFDDLCVHVGDVAYCRILHCTRW